MMKLAIVIFALVAVAVATRPVIDLDLIEEVNSQPGWKAGVNEVFRGMTMDDMKKLLNVQVGKEQPIGMVGPEAAEAMKKEAEAISASIPDNFLASKQFPECGNLLSPNGILNQERCGSCWAFSASEVLSDAYCIQSKAKVDMVLSPQDLVSCDTTNMGCNGGILGNAWSWLEAHGITTWDCLPYTSGNGTTGACPQTCANGDSIKRYKAVDAKHVTSLFGRSDKIAADVAERGVAQAAFTVFEDFMSYKSGIYVHKTGGELGGHAVKITGFGTVASDGSCNTMGQSWDCAGASPGEKYWVVANSWGESWGQNGFFLMKRGNGDPTHTNFEGDVWSGLADLS